LLESENKIGLLAKLMATLVPSFWKRDFSRALGDAEASLPAGNVQKTTS